MITARATLRSLSPYSQSRAHVVPKLEKETGDAYEQRTWKERLHTDEKGMVYIPHSAFKNCLSEAAKYLALQVPGKGKTTYTKRFEAGVLVLSPTPLGVHKDDVPGETLYLNADGVRGSGKRVWRTMPFIKEWRGEVEFVVLDPMITEDVFRRVLEEAGKLIGIGRYRPRNNGIYGRFAIERLDWIESDLARAA
ncbi:MAG: hypothetical protein ACYDD1_14905 [Caulobacteraceae bacterium]